VLETVPLPEPQEALAPPVGASYLEHRPIGSVTADVSRPAGEPPPSPADNVLPAAPPHLAGAPPARPWQPLVYHWEAPALRHQPLYFEEINLERHGYSCRGLRLFQPALSGARFFATIPALPYLTAACPPCERTYTLGHYRPGSPVPFRHHWFEWRLGPGAVQAAVVNAIVFTFP
jgi:hypothetical protein